MIPAYDWETRQFSFEHLAPALFPDVVERFRGTPARVAELVAGVDASLLTRRPGDDWSIQENIGHLFDVEALWAARIEQFLNGEATLLSWDNSNQVTYDADYNNNDLADILGALRAERAAIAARLDGLEARDVLRTALHASLGQQVRMIDVIYYACAHDDHHLAQITRLKRAFSE